MCRTEGVHSFASTSATATTRPSLDAETGGLFPPLIPSMIIGGRGVDVLTGGVGADILKGNDGRDSLRGRRAPTSTRADAGRDTLQTLDGNATRSSPAAMAGGDLLRADKIDPRPKHCELGSREPVEAVLDVAQVRVAG